MLEVRDVSAGYGPLPVLHEVTLDVRRGEAVAIVGANNAGKSTLLKTIVGLHAPSAGSIAFEGSDVAGLPAYEIANRGIVLVPEGRGVFPEMTVEENLLMGGHTPRARPHRRDGMSRVYALFPRLAERRRQLASRLSGGEQTMLALGRGLLGRPEILILDEPSLGLSPVLVRELFHVLMRLNAEGLTLLLVEQNLKFSLELSQRSYVLLHGRVHLSGDSKALAGDERVRRAYLGVAG